MSHDETTLRPDILSWQDIPQDVKPTLITPYARRRALEWLLHGAGWIAVVVLIGALIYGGLHMLVLGGPDGAGPAAPSEPVRHVHVETDGVLDEDWVRAVLALPGNARMLDLRLPELRARIEAHGQVERVILTLAFPDTLAVRLTERAPLFRLRAAKPDGTVADFLVDSQGAVFEGINHDPLRIAALPWLEGARLRRRDGQLQPIPEASEAAAFLARAALAAPHLVRTWRVVSVADLPRVIVRSDEVREAALETDDLEAQLARLDYILDYSRARGGGQIARVDLGTGQQVALAPPPGLHDAAQPANRLFP